MSTHFHDEHLNAPGIQAFLDDGLSAGERRQAEEHLDSCARCAARVDSWSTLFQELDELPRLVPHEGFQRRVMSHVSLPEPRSLAARVTAAVRGFLPERHVGSEALQDLADGLLPEAAVARVKAHLDGCGRCSREMASWHALHARLDGLGHLEPSPDFGAEVMATWRLEQGSASLGHLEPSAGFAARVMKGVHIPSPASAAAGWRVATPARPAPAWEGLLAAARRLVPQTRQLWAALLGVALTPAVTLGLVLWTVFSHPTLTPGALASFAWWKATDLAAAGWGSLSGFALDRAGLFQAYEALGGLLSSPGTLAALGLAFAAGSVVSAWILYRNLIATHHVDGRYAHAHG